MSVNHPMARLAPNPHDLLEQLRRVVIPAAPASRDEPTSVDRILDAAHAAFADVGVAATTMTRIARDAGVSREWLYRQFANRDALVVAVAQRELGRFIDGLAGRAFGTADLDTVVTETFIYAVEFLRDDDLLQQVLKAEPGAISGRLLHEGTPLMGVAVRACAGYLGALAALEHEQAVTISEVLVRLVATITLIPTATLDLHDPTQLRRFAATVVPGVVAAAIGPTLVSPTRKGS